MKKILVVPHYIERKYMELCNTPSDINRHLPTLRRYAEDSPRICEMGVRQIVSTYALLMGKPKEMVSIDRNNCKWLPLRKAVRGTTDFQFRLGNTLEIEIEPTDLLFIDTLHNYDQLKEELRLHGNKSSKYLIFHDTSTFEWIGESCNGGVKKGLWPAIEEFIKENHHWELHQRYFNNNGLTILRRLA